MAKTLFTNLSILNQGRGGLTKLFNDTGKERKPVDQGLGNINKDFGDGKAGERVSNQVTGNLGGVKNDVNKSKKSADGGPDKMKKMNEKDGAVDKKANDKLPIKADEKKGQKKWMKETQPPPDVDVKNKKEDYSGKVTKKDKPPVRDKDKEDLQKEYTTNNDKQTKKQKIKDNDTSDRNKYKPEPLKDTIGPGPKVMDNPISANLENFTRPNPNNPNPEMYPGSSFQTGQAPTPKMPTNDVSRMVRGMKQPPTAKPSFRLPRG